jgi:hypothetical protein
VKKFELSPWMDMFYHLSAWDREFGKEISTLSELNEMPIHLNGIDEHLLMVPLLLQLPSILEDSCIKHAAENIFFVACDRYCSSLGPFQSHQNISLNWRDFHRCVTWDKHQ